MRLTPQMHQILKLYLQRKSPYRIARELDIDPPQVYASLKIAKANFAEADKMLQELKALGWPDKLAEVQEQIRSRSKHAETQEIAIKMG